MVFFNFVLLRAEVRFVGTQVVFALAQRSQIVIQTASLFGERGGVFQESHGQHRLGSELRQAPHTVVHWMGG